MNLAMIMVFGTRSSFPNNSQTSIFRVMQMKSLLFVNIGIDFGYGWMRKLVGLYGFYFHHGSICKHFIK